jgi:peptide-methionine (R)-S-oxide reductase
MNPRNRVARATIALCLTALLLPVAAHAAATPGGGGAPRTEPRVRKLVKTDAEWRRILTPEQFRVLREKGTEIAFTGRYWNQHAPGIYRCAACHLEVFDSRTKFDSGTGWPSFWAPVAGSHVLVGRDLSLGMERDELSCARCGGHLGHVFDDGPAPTHLRYCINSVSLEFVPAK